MSILIDAAIWPAHDRLWCHMVSDTSLEELHAFAAALGVPERGFEGDHYDIPESHRDAAISAGALEVSSRQLVNALYLAGLRRRPHSPNSTWEPHLVARLDERKREPLPTVSHT
jgi:hypothetical protein